jgi:hypothetical protein
METLFSWNRTITVLLITLKSNVGLVLLALAMIFVDALGSSFATSLIFSERFSEINQDNAVALALLAGSLFSTAMLVSILIMSLREYLRKRSVVLAVASAFLSFIGFMVFIVPKDTVSFSMLLTNANVMFWIKVTMALVLAFFPAYVVDGVSRELATNNSVDENGEPIIERFSAENEAMVAKKLLAEMQNMDLSGGKKKRRRESLPPARGQGRPSFDFKVSKSA